MPFMLPTILKNLFTGYATRLYPVQVREPFENARGHITFNEDKCIMCGACAQRCPSVAITVEKKKNILTFYPLRCLVCEVCVHVCPSDAIDLIYKWRSPLDHKPIELYKSVRLEHIRESTEEAKQEVPEERD
ncbi:MAG TPA: 4Fe-4S binding protein [Syntrophales bacterium]|nr:4Fe-4S binding protein [Syntrophales bacterium]